MENANKNIKTIIIEDEFSSQNLLSTIINEYCINLELIGVATDMPSGIKLINATKPDLVFLDIELGNGNAFDLLDCISDKDFSIIISTAYENYALKAFKYEAVDYLLKPYSPKDVIQAVSKVKKRSLDRHVLTQLKQIMSDTSSEGTSGKLCIPSSEGIKVFNLADVVRIEADGSYCVLHSIDRTKFVASKTLKDIEEMLPSKTFYRVHVSHLINLSLIDQYLKEEGGAVIMNNGDRVPLSRRKKQEFLELMSNNL